MSESASVAEPAGVIDLRPQFRPPGDQGRRGTCVAFAVTAAHEQHHQHGDSAPDDLSEETLYWGCKQLDGIARPGTRLSAADLALQRWGQPLEELWPYDPEREDTAADYAPPAAAVDPVNCRRIALRRLTVDDVSVTAELAAGRAVIVAFRVWEAFRRLGESPLPAPKPDELFSGGHAAVIVGYDPTSSAFLFRNSWGNGWGDGGHAWINTDVVALFLGAWVIEPGAQHDVAGSADDDQILTRGA